MATLNPVEQELYNKIKNEPSQSTIAGELVNVKNKFNQDKTLLLLQQGVRTARQNPEVNRGAVTNVGGYSIKKIDQNGMPYWRISGNGTNMQIAATGGTGETSALRSAYAKNVLGYSDQFSNLLGSTRGTYNAIPELTNYYNSLGLETTPFSTPKSGQQLTDEELAQVKKEGNALFTQQTGGFTPSTPEALAAAGTVSSETVKPTFQTSNGQINQPLNQPQAGSLLSKEQLSGLTENDIARTTGNNIYRRDLAKEQSMLGEYAKAQGAPKTEDDWRKFHDYVYGGVELPNIASTEKTQIPDNINAGILKDVEIPEYQSVADQNVINAAGLTQGLTSVKGEGSPQYNLTKSQKEEENIIGDIQNIYKELEGEDAFRISEEEKQGIPGMEESLNDLKTKLQALQNEEASIPLQLESGAVGKGITTTILGRQEKELLRQNAIQSLNVATQISAMQGLLDTAQMYADKAVDAKYATKKAELDTALANLELLRKSPSYTTEEKNQSLAMSQILDAQKREIDKQEDEDRSINKIVMSTAQNVADSRALSAIQNASSELEALQLAGRLATEDGWQYVATPAERDKLASQGYEIYENQALGRTYAKKVEPTTLKTSGEKPKIASAEKPLSTNQIEQFRRSYGWTPPFGFTQSQLLQYMEDNPDATPDELEAGVKQITGVVSGKEQTTPETKQFLSEDYFRGNFSKDELKKFADKFGLSKWYSPASMDINRFLSQLNDIIKKAREEGYTDQEILKYIKNK